MLILEVTSSIQLARDLIDSTTTDDNESRKKLKSITRTMISETFEAADRVLFQEECGVTVNRAIDMVNREVLIALCGAAIKTHGTSNLEWIQTEVKAMAVAMRDDSLCHPAQRGNGKSRGWHINAMSRADAIDSANDLIVSYGLGHAVTTPTNTNTNTGTTPMNKVMLDVTKVADLILAAYDVLAESCDVTLEDLHNAGHTSTNAGKLYDAYLSVLNEDGNEPDPDYTDPRVGVLAAVEIQLEHDPENAKKLDELDDSEAGIATRMVKIINVPLMGMSDVRAPKSIKAKATHQPMPVDPAFEQAVNSLLGQATKHEITDINAYIAQHVETQNKIVDLESEILRLQSAKMSAPTVAKSGTVQVDASTLSYEVVMQKASDLFPAPDGSKSRQLDFDVVTLEWTDSSGNVVQHPDCPFVDESYQFRLRHLVKFLTAKHFGQNVWLHGHTGTGKTTLAEQIAARLGFPVERLNLDSNLERADIVGGTEIVVEEGVPTTNFKEGILPRAMQQPCMFVLDEIDAGRPDVLFVIQRALEGKGLTLTEDGGRTVQPHELFFFCATANSRGQGDEHGWYQGVRPMNLAMLNRFGAFIEVPYLDQDDEERLLKSAYPALKDDEVRKMTQFATEIRTAFTSGELSQTMSPRNLHAMSMYFLHFKNLMSDSDAMREAVSTTVTDSAPADSTHRIEEIASRVFA